ncbi:uncharacterized protein LOC133193766 [Saccostrea echinata]|uniref:uncharacterized protein LOC133193766 n=1 Tax=Saccostrea echinata TaxID=191078 RepID=UPI002A834A90|nr:uncharacterized protein LOC133193766 [Saccostrea echinata]
MASSQGSKVKREYAERIEVELMKFLEDHIHLESNNLQKIKLYLKQHVPSSVSSITEIFDSLKSKGLVTLGNYKVLSDVIQNIDVRTSHGIKDFERRIQAEMGGGSVGHRQMSANCAAARCTTDEYKLDMLFDFLSRKLSPNDMLIFSTYLDGSQMAETAHSFRNPSDTYFRILHNWKSKNPSIDHRSKLKEIFSSMDRQDLAEEMDHFSVDQYKYTGLVIEPMTQFSITDLNDLANNLATRYYHVVRYLGMRQRTIDQVEVDHPNIREQIYQVLLAIIRKRPDLTRQDVCNALFYADHSDVIEILNSEWRHGS